MLRKKKDGENRRDIIKRLFRDKKMERDNWKTKKK